MKAHYTTEETNAILEKALSAKPMPGDMSREQLVKLAEEVGVTPEELRTAEAELNSRLQMDALREDFQAYRAQYRRRASVITGIVAAIMALMLLAVGSGNDLSPMPVLGIVVLVVSVLWLKSSNSSQRCFRLWLEQRERRGSWPM